MNKPITMVIKETKKKLINDCNESGLSPAILDLIMQAIYADVHSLAERQALEEEMAYAQMVSETSKDIGVAEEITDLEK